MYCTQDDSSLSQFRSSVQHDGRGPKKALRCPSWFLGSINFVLHGLWLLYLFVFLRASPRYIRSHAHKPSQIAVWTVRIEGFSCGRITFMFSFHVHIYIWVSLSLRAYSTLTDLPERQPCDQFIYRCINPWQPPHGLTQFTLPGKALVTFSDGPPACSSEPWTRASMHISKIHVHLHSSLNMSMMARPIGGDRPPQKVLIKLYNDVSFLRPI